MKHLTKQKSGNYAVKISTKGKLKHYGSYPLGEAIEVRDSILENLGRLPKTIEEITLDGEHWTPFYASPDNYMVSNLGRIFSKPRKKPYRVGGKLLKTTDNSRGRVKVGITIDGTTKTFGVGQAVYYSFNPEDLNKNLEIDHIDRNIFNNRLDNLRLVTRIENISNRSVDRGDMQCIYKKKSGYLARVRKNKKEYTKLFNKLEDAKMFRDEIQNWSR